MPSEFASLPTHAKVRAVFPLSEVRERNAKIAIIEKKMRYLFHMEIINNDVVSQYNILEAEWKELTTLNFNLKML